MIPNVIFLLRSIRRSYEAFFSPLSVAVTVHDFGSACYNWSDYRLMDSFLYCPTPRFWFKYLLQCIVSSVPCCDSSFNFYWYGTFTCYKCPKILNWPIFSIACYIFKDGTKICIKHQLTKTFFCLRTSFDG